MADFGCELKSKITEHDKSSFGKITCGNFLERLRVENVPRNFRPKFPATQHPSLASH